MGGGTKTLAGAIVCYHVPQIGDIKRTHEPQTNATVKKTLREVLGGLEPSFKKVPKAPSPQTSLTSPQKVLKVPTPPPKLKKMREGAKAGGGRKHAPSPFKPNRTKSERGAAGVS